jgi:alpha-tubulin suppressor-like RCC1 family protein
VAIAAGYQHSLLLKADGTVAACGRYAMSPQFPIMVPAGLSNVIAVSGGDSHSVALRADGTVVAWGLNTSGQTNVPPELTNAIAISAGADHTLALKADGSVVSWGAGPAISAGLSNIVAVAAGRGNSMVLKAGGTVNGWGAGQAGSGGFNLTALSNVVAISGSDNCCYDLWLALQANGQVVRVRGTNYSGMSTILSDVVAISASRGTDHHINLALHSDGTVSPILGFNFWKALYCQPFAPCSFPDVPPDLSNVVAVASGDGHNLALVGTDFPVLLTNSAWDTNGFRVTVSTQSGRVYRLEYKDSLMDSNWLSLPLVAGNGSSQVLSDPTAAGAQRFYRVRRW